MNGFLQRILQVIMKKNSTWNIRRLVNEMIDPATQHIILMIVGFLFYFAIRERLVKQIDTSIAH